jgi:hemoglobin-like flavoprotein
MTSIPKKWLLYAQKLFVNDMDLQSVKLFETLQWIVQNIQNTELLQESVTALAQRHLGYGVQYKQYEMLQEALLATLQEFLKEKYTTEVHQTWSKAYQILLGFIREAYEKP